MIKKIRCVIPCAGLGTRMNMKINESKELLIDPSTNKPIIEYSLDLCRKYKLDPLIITRIEKQDLIEYCQNRNIKVLILDELKGEWPTTVLQSEFLWNPMNILILPDTKFKDENIIDKIKNKLKSFKYVFAAHKVNDISKWGAIDTEYGNLHYSEKPQCPGVKGLAWGIIGFHNKEGKKLFTNMQTKTKWFKTNISHCILKLKVFKDITRTGRIE